jgi:hypothetical protein
MIQKPKIFFGIALVLTREDYLEGECNLGCNYKLSNYN